MAKSWVGEGDASKEEVSWWLRAGPLLDAGAPDRWKAEEQAARATDIWEGAQGQTVTPEDIARYLRAYAPRDLTTDEYFLGRPEQAGVYADPALIAAQQQALRQFQQLARGEVTPADRQAQALLRQQQDEAWRGQRGAIVNQAQAMGQGGAAMTGAMLSGQQGQMNVLAQQNAMLDIERQRRAMQALGSSADLASQMRSTGFGEAQTRAQAADAFNSANMDWRRRAGLVENDWRDRTGQMLANQANVQWGQDTTNRTNLTNAMMGHAGVLGNNAAASTAAGQQSTATLLALFGTLFGGAGGGGGTGAK